MRGVGPQVSASRRAYAGEQTEIWDICGWIIYVISSMFATRSIHLHESQSFKGRDAVGS
jgi:hypothetical protein